MVNLTSTEVQQTIATFLDGEPDQWDWDDFISIPITDPYLDAIRVICGELPRIFPPDSHSRDYCNKDGVNVLRAIVREFLQ